MSDKFYAVEHVTNISTGASFVVGIVTAPDHESAHDRAVAAGLVPLFQTYRVRPATPADRQPFQTVDDVRRAHTGHWFDPDTLRFFRSRVSDQLYGGRFFTTSEKGPYGPRAYSVRVALDGAEIETVGEFQGFASSGAAHAIAQQLAHAIRNRPGRVEVRHDPYPDTPAARGEREPNRRHYEWRCYVVLADGRAFPIGVRTTHYSAHGIKRQLQGR